MANLSHAWLTQAFRVALVSGLDGLRRPPRGSACQAQFGETAKVAFPELIRVTGQADGVTFMVEYAMML